VTETLLPSAQLVLDTNILLHLLRGRADGQQLEQRYQIAARNPRAVVPAVVRGEIKALAYKFGWDSAKHARVDEMIAKLPIVDITPMPIVDAYARIDCFSHQRGVSMGKNDLWIAAAAQVLEGVLLTTDRDFDHLPPEMVRVERVVLGPPGDVGP
jgi:tRNA(fMet)-specific endonuclease VapC